MQFCQEHWDQLKTAIDELGLSPFIARSGREAVDSIMRQVEGDDDPVTDFDPLMNAHWAIFSNALQSGGIYLMGFDDDGKQYCPLCELAKHVDQEMVESWIIAASIEQLKNARELGLVAGVQ